MSETVGVLGNGGREMVLAKAAAMSDQVGEVIGIGLNPGFDDLEKGRSIDVMPKDIDGIVRAIGETGINVLLVGPELPLDLGVVDAVEAWAEANGKEIAVLGPRKNAALEGSKVAQRELWEELGLNTGEWEVFSGESDIERAVEYIADKGAEWIVLKPDGLTGGKGVSLPKDQEEANRIVAAMLREEVYKGATSRIIIEERGFGPEVSATSIADGNGRRVELAFTQDHKRLLDSKREGEDNPNTGGMGAYLPVPAPILRDVHRSEITRGIGLTQDKMAEQGRPFKGTWYEAEMLEGSRVRRIELNNRGGDPETQALVWAMIHSGIDVFELYYSAARGELSFTQDDIPQNLGVASVTLTCAAEGYATRFKQVSGDRVYGLHKDYGENVHIDLAGIAKDDGDYYTNGGRVLYVTGIGKTVDQAAAAAYRAVGRKGVNWRGMIVRNTIAQQALTRK